MASASFPCLFYVSMCMNEQFPLDLQKRVLQLGLSAFLIGIPPFAGFWAEIRNRPLRRGECRRCAASGPRIHRRAVSSHVSAVPCEAGIPPTLAFPLLKYRTASGGCKRCICHHTGKHSGPPIPLMEREKDSFSLSAFQYRGQMCPSCG